MPFAVAVMRQVARMELPSTRGLNDGGLPWRCELVHRIRMRELSRIVQGIKKGPHLAPFQRASAALRALWLRCRFVIFAALAGPPFLPPKRPKATAAGFL